MSALSPEPFPESSQELAASGPALPPRAVPVSPAERMQTLDVLRGFALLGILVMNIQFFSMPMAAYSNPSAYGDLQGINYAVWLVSYLFANLKFISMFSMLFGAGIVLMLERAAARGEPRPSGLHVRRMLWLLLFGMVHAYAIWSGDILVPYATCGLLLFWLHRARPRVLIALGLLLIAGGSLVNVLGGWSMQFWPEDAMRDFRTMWAPEAKVLSAEIAAFRGNWLQQMPERASTAFFMQFPGLFFFSIWRIGGMMMLGMGLQKNGFLKGEWPPRHYRLVLAAGGLLGLALSAIGVIRNETEDWSLEYGFFLGPQWNYWGSLSLMLAYAAGLILLVRGGVWRSVTARLAAVGRMAFSNYILQSVLCTLLFYGHGLGLFGSIERWGQMLVVLAVWAVLLVGSPWWLQRYRYGPLEWLWRRLTYGALAVGGAPALGQTAPVAKETQAT